MTTSALQQQVVAAVGEVAAAHPRILSATVTGSFLTGDGLAGVGDIDLVVVVDILDGDVFEDLCGRFETALTPVLAGHGFGLRVNPTLGPLKLNQERLAVLHLMLYSARGHVDHVIKSPFTCLDWQRSSVWFGSSLAGIYPCFGLMPRHFFGARRSARDYLSDLLSGEISYRELRFDTGPAAEVRRRKAMTLRDRHEFAYHVMKFLMENFLKLVRRRNAAAPAGSLPEEFFGIFPAGAGEFTRLYHGLRRRKVAMDFADPIDDVVEKTAAFVETFERQFRDEFVHHATRHVFFRHAPTALNDAAGARAESVRFLGRRDEACLPVDPAALEPVVAAARSAGVVGGISSPLSRCRTTLGNALSGLAITDARTDDRLIEIDYGHCEGLTVAQVRDRCPGLFDAWARREDPPFPGGENTGQVLSRVRSFLNDGPRAGEASAICTHNVVLRCMVGDLLGVPMEHWHMLRIDHLVPITVVQTPRHGLFLDVDEPVHAAIFRGFEHPAALAPSSASPTISLGRERAAT